MIRIRGAVVDEVRVEQVVVARPQLDRVRQEGHLDPAADRRGLVVRRRDDDATLERERPIRLDDPERHEQPGDRRPVVDPAQRIGDSPERVGLVDGLVTDRRPDDEPRDEVALGPDERGHLRPDADAGRGDRRRVLDLPADAEQVRVVAGQPDDPALVGPGGVDPEVPVRDPARQGREGQLTAPDLRDLLERADEVVVELPVEDALVGHLADHRLAGRLVRRDLDLVELAALGHDVVQGPDDEHGTDRHLEDRPCRELILDAGR